LHKLIIQQCSHGSFHVLMGDFTACLRRGTKVRWRLDPPHLEGRCYYQLHPGSWCVWKKHIAEVQSWPSSQSIRQNPFFISHVAMKNLLSSSTLANA
jgi:hypothetical protein